VQPDPGESRRAHNAGLVWQDLASQARSASSNLAPVEAEPQPQRQ